MVDCHWRLTPEAARRILPVLAEIGVVWLECPLPETAETVADLRDLRGRANALGMRLCGLETFGGWDAVAPFVEGGAYDVVMPDVKHAGSFGAIQEIAERARTHGVAVSLHNPSGPVAHLVSVHVSAAMGGAERLESQWNESPLFFKLTDPAPTMPGGICRPGEAPGLGATLRPPEGDDAP